MSSVDLLGLAGRVEGNNPRVFPFSGTRRDQRERGPLAYPVAHDSRRYASDYWQHIADVY